MPQSPISQQISRRITQSARMPHRSMSSYLHVQWRRLTKISFCCGLYCYRELYLAGALQFLVSSLQGHFHFQGFPAGGHLLSSPLGQAISNGADAACSYDVGRQLAPRTKSVAFESANSTIQSLLGVCFSLQSNVSRLQRQRHPVRLLLTLLTNCVIS